MRATKEGISTNEKDVICAVQKVMRFLVSGKSDKTGEFKEKSKSKVAPKNSSRTPEYGYYSEFEKFIESRVLEKTVIVSVSSARLTVLHKADLVLNSRDLNCCDFSLQFANCLTRVSATIYIQCENLNRRGLRRLIGILKDCCTLFDSRVRILLLWETSLVSELAEMSEIDFGGHEPEKKKTKIDKNKEEKRRDNTELELEKIKDFSTKEQELSDSKNLLEREISECQNNLEIKSKECEKLNSEIEDLQKKNSLKESSLERRVLESEAQVLKMKEDNDCLKMKNDSLEMENDKLRGKYESLKVANESLNMEYNRLKTEQNSLKMKNVLKNSETQTENSNSESKKESSETKNGTSAVSEAGQISDLRKLTEAIRENQKNLRGSSAPEIVKKSIPKIH